MDQLLVGVAESLVAGVQIISDARRADVLDIIALQPRTVPSALSTGPPP